jgi:hypothetical protein
MTITIEWTHDGLSCEHVECTDGTDCPAFPTANDRALLGRAFWEAYYKMDAGQQVSEFIADLLLQEWTRPKLEQEARGCTRIILAKASGIANTDRRKLKRHKDRR